MLFFPPHHLAFAMQFSDLHLVIRIVTVILLGHTGPNSVNSNDQDHTVPSFSFACVDATASSTCFQRLHNSKSVRTASLRQ